MQLARTRSPRRTAVRTATARAVARAVVAAVIGAVLLPIGSPARAHDPTDHGADHEVETTKNALARGGEDSVHTQDPTTPAQARANAAYAAAERRTADPRLTTVRAVQQRRHRPQDRYAMANGCYSLATSGGARVIVDGDGLAILDNAGAPFFFQATGLGRYLIGEPGGRLVAADGDAVTLADEPSPAAEWTARRRGKGYTLTSPDGSLRARGRTVTTDDRGTAFRLRRAPGCTAYPESAIDISGRPHAGISPFQEVRGYVDAHTHGMAFEFLGGKAHCGRPWHEYGAPYALVDCEDHTYTGGFGAALEAFLSGEPRHDPVGWPTFVDWPAPESLTHEGTYYRWMERAWRGGQRLFVNLLVENNKLCEVYPLKKNSCDDMDSVRLQAQRMYEFQDYIDAQFGGPGKGFYRIVKNPWQARQVINAGKMAVIMGMETSIPFGCTMKADVPQCTLPEISRQLDELEKLGVRQLELVNKFDNALSGVAGDSGTTGIAVNSANFLETASFWDMEHCEPADGESHDRNQLGPADITPDEQDALFGAIGDLLGLADAVPVAPPVYGPPDHCNSRGLTTLGAETINEIVDRQLVFDPDHMSVKARNTALDQVEELGYPGVISSHSWATPDAYPRIYRLGGFITPYAGDSTGFVEKWRRHLGWADERYYWGFGFGADMNGLGAQGDPRGADVPNPVSYPFTGINGITVKQQRAGERVYDINVDGVAQYGLYPDWVEDLRMVAAGEGGAIVEDMTRGAEAYLQMWERARGIAPDSCRNPELRRWVGQVRSLLRPGMSAKAVQRAVGQPWTRRGTTYGFCAKAPGKDRVLMKVDLTRGGKVTRVRRAG